jgi:hypothetical protein
MASKKSTSSKTKTKKTPTKRKTAHVGGKRRSELVGVGSDAGPPLYFTHPVLHAVLTGHDEGVPFAGRKLAQLRNGRSAHGPKRDRPMDLEAARAPLSIPQDDVRVSDVFERDTAGSWRRAPVE